MNQNLRHTKIHNDQRLSNTITGLNRGSSRLETSPCGEVPVVHERSLRVPSITYSTVVITPTIPLTPSKLLNAVQHFVSPEKQDNSHDLFQFQIILTSRLELRYPKYGTNTRLCSGTWFGRLRFFSLISAITGRRKAWPNSGKADLAFKGPEAVQYI